MDISDLNPLPAIFRSAPMERRPRTLEPWP